MAVIKTDALVLNAMRWQESSKIVHLFSAEHGYLKVIAKGALRPKSPFRAALETLNHVEAVITHKPSRGLQLLTGVSLNHAWQGIRADLRKTALALAVMELLKKLFPEHEPVPDFFDYLTGLLAALDGSAREELRPFLWHAVLELSDVLGFAWRMDVCLETGRPPEHFPVFLDSRRGGIACGRGGGGAGALDRPQWEALLRLSRAAVADLETLDVDGLAAYRPDLTHVGLSHLAFHTETALSLQSLTLYE